MNFYLALNVFLIVWLGSCVFTFLLDWKHTGNFFKEESFIETLRHVVRHEAMLLVLGPFAFVKENRKKICPKCFGNGDKEVSG